MEWQQILGFYHTARLRSFTKAAQATFRSQSALSQQIKALEEELDCQLIERIGTRRLVLTTFGEHFLQFADKVLLERDNLLSELNELRDLHRGPLRIAAPFTTLYHLMPRPLKRFRERFPEVRFSILDRPQDAVIELVRNGDVDFGIALESIASKGLNVVRWKKLHSVLLMPKNHPLTNQKSFTLRDIRNAPLILPPKDQPHSYREVLEEHFRRQGIDFHVVMESSNVELSSMYVEMGLGLSFATIVKGYNPLGSRNLAMISLDRYIKPGHLAVFMRKGEQAVTYKKSFLKELFRT